jgi:hypothetical protein
MSINTQKTAGFLNIDIDMIHPPRLKTRPLNNIILYYLTLFKRFFQNNAKKKRFAQNASKPAFFGVFWQKKAKKRKKGD